jgi:hypothetical protein
MTALKINPGGQLEPDQILGRDTLIVEMWRILEGRSIYMNDLRRIGKTQIMVKMHAQPPQGWLSVKCDLGGTHSAEEFATLAYKMSEDVLSKKKRTLRQMKELLGKAAGTQFAGIIKLPDGSPAPWKEVLRRTFADIEEEMTTLGPDQRMVFFWDEVPFLLSNIVRTQGSAVAMEVLDTLRSLGQDHNRIRLLLTGSVGIHHVLEDLKRQGYLGSPLNRMELVQPGPLEPAHGIALAEALLTGANLQCADPATCARELAESVGCVAFYIHKLVSRLPRASSLTPESITKALDREITSDNNDWDLRHYRDRLRPYYGEDEKLALLVLDALAVGGPLTFQAIRQEVSAQMAVEEERLRSLLKLLGMDHYLIRTADNEYRFYLDLIRRWWRLDRNL